ncbi:hypothetical protein [Geitlerinema sp. PCC 9228]|jgi:hypothetical protein|uniref:hypothetical protein n=1 Tax=Geitlerinema sp. PCC 9228 TaxID=111611 RepID=UPI0008F9CC93|nr:hypothetical protein [Geitlerinema sp. PCC 9228]
MNSLKSSTSACRHCRFYTPEGRRGGHCQQLGVRVGGSWTSCSLALPAFAPTWESIDAGWQLVARVGSQRAFFQASDDRTNAESTKSDRTAVPGKTKTTETEAATSVTM